MSYSSSLSNVEIEELDLTGALESVSAEDFDPIDASASSPTHNPKTIQLSGFDYSGLSNAVAEEAEATATRIRERLRGSILTTGTDLLDIKEKVGHGRFGKWLSFHFGWKERTAQNYMNAATAFASIPKIIDILPATTVYKLAARSTPDELRRDVVETIEKGLLPNRNDIEQRIAETRAGVKSDVYEDATSRDATFEVASSAAAATSECDRPADAAGEPAPSAEAVGPPSRSPGMDYDRYAKKIAAFIKSRSGAEFYKIRAAILTIDPVALRKALEEA